MDRKNFILALLISALLGISAHAQSPVTKLSDKPLQLDHLDMGLSLGTTGVGLDVEMPVFKWLSARAGISYMPHFNIPMTFGLETYGDDGLNTGKIAKMQELMFDYMGIEVDDKVKMNAKSMMLDFKFLLDFKPIPGNDHWRITTGFFWGASRVGHIENTIYEMPSLVGVSMYNSLYDYFVNWEFMDKPIFGDVFLDANVGFQAMDKFVEYGRVGVNMGTFTNTTEYWNAGDTYIMEPNNDCMVKANMRVNSFKPYLGLGYSTHLSSDKRWRLGVDAGVLYWGGTPSVITHNNLNYAIELDGETVVPTVNLSKDVEGVHGKVGDYLDFAKSLKVYPVLNFRISYRIF